MPDKVCIIGFSESTRNKAPVKDNSWEFWGMGTLWKYVNAPWSRWFEMHSPDYIYAHKHRWPDYPVWLKQTSLPVYMLASYSEFPSSVAYPFDDIKKMLAERFDMHEGRFAGSTVAYMLLMAAQRGAKEIAIYGVDMIKDTEWGYQRPNCNLIIGLLKGAGVKVYIPPECSLINNPWLYGYEESTSEQKGPIKKSDIEARIFDLNDHIKTIEDDVEKTRQTAQAMVDKERARFHEHRGALREDKIWLERVLDWERGGK